MDFAAVLADLRGYLDATGQRYALIGGLALAAYGIPRVTVDLDLAVDAAAQDDLIRHLLALGYATLYRSAGYSNHQHPQPSRGRVDLVYVRDETADRIFAEARETPGPGERPVPVAAPEHLAAMKVLAMKNDPDRMLRDLADIRELLRFPDVDREQIRAYFHRHGLEDRFDELERQL